MTLEQIHDYCINEKNREIYLHGVDTAEEVGAPGIEYRMANKFIKNLHYLESKSSAPILVHLHTCGGDWEEGMAMFDAITLSPCPITIWGYAEIRSMSSIVFQAADLRILMPNSIFMVHSGDTWYEGVSHGLQAHAEMNKYCDDKMIEIYSQATGLEKEYIWAEIKDKVDWYLQPEEAVSLGFADEVMEINNG